MAKGNDELMESSERDKARGQTPSQQEIAEYHAGDFQTTDPVTGEERGPLAPHANPENWGGPVGVENENPFPSAKERQQAAADEEAEAQKAAKAAGAATPASKTTAKKAGRKRGR